MAKDETKAKVMGTESMPASAGGNLVESPVSGIGASKVYRLDMGESLPAQQPPSSGND